MFKCDSIILKLMWENIGNGYAILRNLECN
jgi:hypothetical protein